jgi:hypothetical protein
MEDPLYEYMVPRETSDAANLHEAGDRALRAACHYVPLYVFNRYLDIPLRLGMAKDASIRVISY